MKGNNGTGNVVERDDWRTPQKLWDALNKQYEFYFDCCATAETTKCLAFSSDFERIIGLLYPERTVWMNPPFSKAREMFEHFFKIVKCGVAIYRCDNLETSIYQDLILKHASWVWIPKGRISYEGHAGKGSRFASALIGFNVEPPMNDLFPDSDGCLLVVK